MVSAGAREVASLLPELLQMRRIVTHPLAHAVVYGFCGAIWGLSGGLALGVLGRRVGGGVGARLVSAGNSAVHVSAWPFLLAPIALILFGLRAAVAAMEFGRQAIGTKAASCWEHWGMLCAMLGYMVKDVFKMAMLLLVVIMAVGCWMQICSLGKRSVQEKAGAMMVDIGIVSMAVLHCFFVCPAWVTEWRTGQQS